MARAEAGEGPGLLGPPLLDLHRDRLGTGARLRRTFAVSGYPREVGYAWLAPLLRASAGLDVALHVEPVAAELAARRLQRQRARFESSRRLERERGSLADPALAASAEAAHELADRLARGESRLFRAGLYLTVSAASEPELDEASARLETVCASQLLAIVPASFRAWDGWVTCLPLGLDRLRLRRTFDSEALAAAFPFALAEPPLAERGCFYGLGPTGAPVVFDRFAGDNYNSVVLARSGAGKSYLAKLEALRLACQGVQVFILDPEDEYRRLCETAGGAYLPLAGPGAVTLNPLEPPATRAGEEPEERVTFLAELVELLAGGLGGAEHAALDRAARATYRGRDAGRPPLLRDLAGALEHGGADARALAARLGPFTTGSLARLFSAPTSVRPDAEVVCFSLRGLPERLKQAALLVCLDAIWRSLDATPRRRCVLVDEAWLVMREPAGASFLHRLAKSARKRWCGLTAVTQDAGDLLATELGHAVVTNAASQILLRQAPQAIDRVREAFRLTEGESRYLLTAPRGHGLFVVGDERFPLHVVASAAEHAWATSDPAELAAEAGP